ncbi:MAG: RNA 2',3'-cyclic phosphodiesterase [Planctomycetes bacterium]|nr:RNA 2',3'-cyclic phosphodiesterase [Planctomycetota bacterium]MCB9918485.1 RNA 2',3'-cyclic phosphodiesterase [Planctomycetota bacterium]
MQSAEIRTFVALRFDAAFLDGLVRQAERVRGALSDRARELRFVDPGHLHATVRFLGSTTDVALGTIATRLARIAEGTSSFAVETTGVGCFASRGRVRVVWLGFEATTRDASPLDRLHQEVEAAARGAGYEADTSPFAAHVTLARVRRGRRVARGNTDVRLEPIRGTCIGIDLLESRLGAAPQARYHTLGAYAFATSAS